MVNIDIQLVAKKTGTVIIKLARFYNFFIVKPSYELKFNDIFKNYLTGIVK
jgi:hypothetical protein